MWDGLWQCGGGVVCGVEICGSLYNIGLFSYRIVRVQILILRTTYSRPL